MSDTLAVLIFFVVVFIAAIVGALLFPHNDFNETENKKANKTAKSDPEKKRIEEVVKTPSTVLVLLGKLLEWVKGLVPEKAKDIPLTWVLLFLLVLWNLNLQLEIGDLQSQIRYVSWHSHDDDYAEKRHDHDGDYAEPWHYH